MIPLTNDELRGLVRDAIARVRANPSGASPSPVALSPAANSVAALSPGTSPVPAPVHASQAIFILGPGGDADGNCVIEPAVRCNHCGYCQSYGH